MSQPSLVPAPPPHRKHAVRLELTMTGFADRRLNHLGHACEKPGASCENRTRAFALARRRHSTRPTKHSEDFELRMSNCECRIRVRFAIRISQFALLYWCRRRDSNPHQLVSKTSASARLGHAGKYRGWKMEDGRWLLDPLKFYPQSSIFYLRSSILYPRSSIVLQFLAGPAGLEPATSSSASLRSDPSELRAPNWRIEIGNGIRIVVVVTPIHPFDPPT